LGFCLRLLISDNTCFSPSIATKSWILIAYLVAHFKRLYFPDFFATTCDHMTEFLPMRCKHM
jgi:hypothetical protein